MSAEPYRASFRDLVEAGDGIDDQLLKFFTDEEELVYQVRTPDVGSADPVGLLVYISPKPGAGLPDGWDAVLDQHNLMWVGAENSGNEVHVARRVGMGLLAKVVADQFRSIDASRCFLSGFSGGGRVATMMLPVYPDAFTGALFICGANPLLAATTEEVAALRDKPLVFLTGTGDFNLMDTEMAFATYQHAELERLNLTVVDGLEHALPQPADLDQALRFLTG